MYLLTESLILRDIQVYNSDPVLAKSPEWGPFSKEDSQRFIQNLPDPTEQLSRQNFDFAIFLRGSGMMIGMCCLRRQMGSREASVVCSLNPDFHVAIYLKEVTQALEDFGRQRFDISRFTHPAT